MFINIRCPLGCGEHLWLMSTNNEWIYKCPKCRNRFNEQLEIMPEVK